MDEWDKITDKLTHDNFMEGMEKIYRQAYELFELAVTVGFSHTMAEQFAWDWYKRTMHNLTTPQNPLLAILEQIRMEEDDEGQS